jgi:hypothetical protein
MSEKSELRVICHPELLGKFVAIVPNAEFPHLSRYDGALTEQELRTLLADKYRKSPSEIEMLIREAKRIHEKEDECVGGRAQSSNATYLKG